MDIAQNIARFVREYRKSHRLTRRALADFVEERSGKRLSPATLFAVESAKGGTLKTLERLAAALETDLGYLCSVEEPGVPCGMRSYRAGVQAFGIVSESFRREVRLDGKSGAFSVQTIEKLGKTWYEGPVSVGHEVVTFGDEHGALWLGESPFEVLEDDGDAQPTASTWERHERTDNGPRGLRYQLDFPTGLADGRISYRYTHTEQGAYAAFAEAALLTDEELGKYGSPPDVPPSKLPAVVRGAGRRFEGLSERKRRELPPNWAGVCLTEFPSEKLFVDLRFPQECKPQRLEYRAWLGSGDWRGARDVTSMAEARFVKDREGGRAALRVERPFMGVTYAVLWWPPRFAEWWPWYKARSLAES